MAKATEKMAQKDPENDASLDLLIREVDEDMRVAQLRGWWQRFGSLVVGGCVTVILAAVAYYIVDANRMAQAEEATATLLEAQRQVEKGQLETAHKTLAPLAEKDSPAGQLAALHDAYAQWDDSKNTTGFEKLANQNRSPFIADLAKIQLGKAQEVKEKSGFYPLAAEQQAIALLQQGKKEEARALLQSLLDRDDLTSSQASRLQELLQGANG